MYTRMVRAFVGIGSVDTVLEAPDSALVGVAGPVATPSAAACLPLYTTYDVSVSSFAKIAYRQCRAIE